MKEKASILTSGGCGDCIMGIRCAEAARRAGYKPIVYVLARNEVYFPIQYLFGNSFDLRQCAEFDDSIRNRAEELEEWKKRYWTDGLIYFSCPDNLFNGPLAFDCERFDTRPQAVKQIRVGEHLWKPEGIIYCALNSSTPAYQLGERIPQIVKRIAQKNPMKTVYFNNVERWAGEKLNNGVFDDLPPNVAYLEDQSFNDSLEWLKKSEYVLAVDNGISHIANEMNIPMTLLDTRIGAAGLPWFARWKYSSDRSIPATTDAISIAELIKLNLQIPQTSLIPRQTVLENLDADWKKILLIKDF